MKTIIWESGKRPQRGFRTLVWQSVVQSHDQMVEGFWISEVNMKFERYLHFLKMRFFLEETSVKLQEFVFDSPGFFEDEVFLALLRVHRSTNISREILLKRYNKICILLGMRPIEQNLYLTWKGNLQEHITQIEVTIPHIKRYSGYVRSIASLGKHSGPRVEVIPETFEWTNSSDINWDYVLTVGKFPGFSLEITIP